MTKNAELTNTSETNKMISGMKATPTATSWFCCRCQSTKDKMICLLSITSGSYYKCLVYFSVYEGTDTLGDYTVIQYS